jgi:putative spermidine/putrescine transport system ATP-binding protein
MSVRRQSLLTTGQSLLLDGITQLYGSAVAVADVTLDIKGGELVALLGPSGCGKTTLLKAIAGFVRQTKGHVVIGGEIVDHLPPNRRTVGIVFQNYALFPHMTVAQNVAYGLEVRGVPKDERTARVAEMLGLVKIDTFADRYPRQLSGGQQQRVAIARALAVQPSILLLDEPFSALDKNLRLDMQIEVKRIQRTAGTTTILVTHDQEEALSMADRVAVLSKGKLEQFAPPTEIYDAPNSLFVNTFVGAANVLAGTVAQLDGDVAWIRLPSGETLRAQKPRGGIAAGTRVSICLRPEHLEIATTGQEGIAGIVEMGLPLGASIVHEVRIADGTAIKVATPRSPGIIPLAAGTAIRVVSIVPATIFPQT